MSDTYLIITELFCKLHDMPFNKIAAERSALTEDEVNKALREKGYHSEDDVEEATADLLKETYLKHLKEHIN
jgi:hypothetical protein